MLSSKHRRDSRHHVRTSKKLLWFVLLSQLGSSDQKE